MTGGGLECLHVDAVVDQAHPLAEPVAEHIAQVVRVGTAAGDHRLSRRDPVGHGRWRHLEEVAGVRGKAPRDPGQPVSEQGDQRGVVREVGVQAPDRPAVPVAAGAPQRRRQRRREG